MAVRLVTPCSEFTLEVESSAMKNLADLCRLSARQETGGVLIGRYSEDRFTVTVTEATSPPEDSSRGLLSFVRGVLGLGDLLLRRWRSRRRSYYVGEWHYHPSTVVEPSESDLRQMHSIAALPEYRCRQPIMLIVGMSRNGQPPWRGFVFPESDRHLEFLPPLPAEGLTQEGSCIPGRRDGTE